MAKKRAAKKHVKDDAQRKEQFIKIRVSEEQKRIIAAAADREGLEVSQWLRQLALRAAKNG
jgi:uncharacterized protein (DUF1778 family)